MQPSADNFRSHLNGQAPIEEAKLLRAPIFVDELELTEPIRSMTLPARADGEIFSGVRFLVRMQHMPMGYATLSSDELDSAGIARAIWEQLSSVINARRARYDLTSLDGLPTGGIPAEEKLVDAPVRHPLVTVVVCTRDRPSGALRTLRGLMTLHYRPFEIILVDNVPSSDATKDAVLAEFGGNPVIRYVRELKPGLSAARNRGVAEAAGEIVAFTDDDVSVDPWWLDGIVRGFEEAGDVACVTGFLHAAELDNAVQLYTDVRQIWGKVFERRVFDLTENRDDSPLYPYSPGIFGTGGNFAMTRAALSQLGGFDEALGAGTPSGGGEELEMFMRTVLAGHRLVYQPSAIVAHAHVADLGELARKMVTYGSGFTAALTAIALRSRRARHDLVSRVPRGVPRVLSINERTKDNPALPRRLIRREYGGMLLGPWLYLKPRIRYRYQARQHALPRSGGAAAIRLHLSTRQLLVRGHEYGSWRQHAMAAGVGGRTDLERGTEPAVRLRAVPGRYS